jgi:hypothetical protein
MRTRGFLTSLGVLELEVFVLEGLTVDGPPSLSIEMSEVAALFANVAFERRE